MLKRIGKSMIKEFRIEPRNGIIVPWF